MQSPESSLIASDRPLNGRATAEMLAASLSFATMACIAHGFQQEVAWPLIAFTRIAMTMAVVLAIVWMAGAPMTLRGNRALWWRTIMGTISLLCTFYSLAHLPVTDTVTIFAVGPVWIAIILAVGFRRPAPLSTWLLAGLAVAGIYVMVRPQFDAALFPLAVAVFGSVTAAGAMVSLSFCRRLPALTVVAHYSTFATLTTLALSLVQPSSIIAGHGPEAVQWLWLIPLGLTGTLGQVFLTSAYGHGTPVLVALVGISQMLFAAGYDVLVWGRHFDGPEIGGMAAVAVAISFSIMLNSREAAGVASGEEAPVGPAAQDLNIVSGQQNA